MRPLLILALAGLGLACAPQLRGECTSDETCPLGTRCLEGLCLVSDEAPADGGDGCPECPDGYHCGETLECVPTTVEILSPGASLLRPSTPLAVLVRTSAPAPVDSVEIAVDDLVSATLVPSPQDGPGIFAGSLQVPARTHGPHALRAAVRWSGGEASTQASLVFDALGPAITVEPVVYPRVSAGLEVQAFAPGAPIELVAFVDDEPAGLAGPPVIGEGERRVEGEDLGDGRWRFTVPAPTPAKFEDTLDLTIQATDILGNASSEKVQVRVSRHAWRWQAPDRMTITAAPALVGDLVVFGDADGVVTALHQADGGLAWQVELDASVVGHISASTDDTTVHAVTRSGAAYWLDAASPRVVARCPEAGVIGREPAAGASVVGETLFVVSRDGHLQVMRPRGFEDGSCLQEHPLAQGAGVSSASLVPLTDRVSAYVATENGRLHRVDVSFPEDLPPVFVDAWTSATSQQDGVHGAPALGRVDTLTSIVVGTDTSRLFGRDAEGSGLKINGKLLSSAIVAGPALVAGDAYLVDQSGEAQRLRLSDGKKLWTPAFRGLARSAGALAGPVVGRSGNTCLTTGARLSCVTSTGALRWSYDEPDGQALDAVTPVLSCEGRLFVASAAGALEAFDTDTQGPADGWSRPGGDARNTSNVRAHRGCD